MHVYNTFGTHAYIEKKKLPLQTDLHSHFCGVYPAHYLYNIAYVLDFPFCVVFWLLCCCKQVVSLHNQECHDWNSPLLFIICTAGSSVAHAVPRGRFFSCACACAVRCILAPYYTIRLCQCLSVAWLMDWAEWKQGALRIHLGTWQFFMYRL